MGFAAPSRSEFAMLLLAALVGALLALTVGTAVGNHMHSYNALHHGLGQEPGSYAHPFISREVSYSDSCTAVGAAGAHWYYSCDILQHNHSNQTQFGYSASSAHTEAFYPVLDHHHHFPH